MTEKITVWTTWDKRDFFTFDVATALLCGEEPESEPSRYRNAMRALIFEKMDTKRWECLTRDHIDHCVHEDEDFIVNGDCRFGKQTVVDFAKENKISSPFIFPEYRESVLSGSEKAHAETLRHLLNENHHWYSKELAAAVKTWIDLFLNMPANNLKVPSKDKIGKLIIKNGWKLSKAARERVATVVNPLQNKRLGLEKDSNKGK